MCVCVCVCLSVCVCVRVQHYRAPMFLDTLSGGLPGGGASSSALVTSSSTRYEPSLHGGPGLHGPGPAAHETCVITGGGGGPGSISDIISLD